MQNVQELAGLKLRRITIECQSILRRIGIQYAVLDIVAIINFISCRTLTKTCAAEEQTVSAIETNFGVDL